MHRKTETMQKTLFLLLIISLTSCSSEYAPKPKGYFRIEFPEKKYQTFISDCPYQFDFPVYAKVNDYQGNQANECWKNVDFFLFNARLHLSYATLKNDLEKHIEDSRMLAYKHIIKAEAINEEQVVFPEKKVYGLVYSIDGATASGLQFYLTDSTKHFLRGALYFNTQTNVDSIQPVSEFIKQDVFKLINTLNWK